MTEQTAKELAQRKLDRKRHQDKQAAAKSRSAWEKKQAKQKAAKEKYDQELAVGREENKVLLEQIAIAKQEREAQLEAVNKSKKMKMTMRPPKTDSEPSLMDIAAESVKVGIKEEGIDPNDSKQLEEKLK